MRFAYADPPYIGQARKHYSADPLCAEVDHERLLMRLVVGYPDGWALSCSSPSLRQILPMCPADVRVMAWVKPFAVFKPNVNPGYCWEPVIVRGGRKLTREQPTVRDWVSSPITLHKGLVGAKPPEFCRWVLDVLGFEDGDMLDDLFPGTGIMGTVAAQGRITLAGDSRDDPATHQLSPRSYHVPQESSIRMDAPAVSTPTGDVPVTPTTHSVIENGPGFRSGWCTPGYVGEGHPRGAHETDAETFLVVSNDDRGSAGVTHICIDCLRESVIIGTTKDPAKMVSTYRSYAMNDRGRS